MKQIKTTGIVLFILGLAIFTSASFLGTFKLTEEGLNSSLRSSQIESLAAPLMEKMGEKEYWNPLAMAIDFAAVYDEVNAGFIANEEWEKVMYDKPHALAFGVVKASADGFFTNKPWQAFAISFLLAFIGALMNILPNVILDGPAGIKNHNIYHKGSTNKGWIAWVVMGYLVSFYVILYFFPAAVVNQVSMLDPISEGLSGNPASQWFLYGFMYCIVMTAMAVRMIIKYRNNRYQIVRTCVVLFFQVAFAFLIPEILVRLNKPYFDFKNAWPLDYDFFFDWNMNQLIADGNMGTFMLVWGIVLTAIIVPVFVYFFGKRWYCSWVCGCGGLAETLGDPYRQHSDKSLKAWKIEKILIHSVWGFAIVMTAATLWTYFTQSDSLIGLPTYDLQKTYGFLIGSVFSGIIGTGFYPIMGNRVWCRFGCPLAAYLGLVQRIKSRFRITTNGSQCISCGNCSTYCEQGIDVRWYAQRGQNIVRSSCVGCGVCTAVCPRGVLKLENGPTKDRINDNPILIGHKHAVLANDIKIDA